MTSVCKLSSSPINQTSAPLLLKKCRNNIFLTHSQTWQILKHLVIYWFSLQEKHCGFEGSGVQVFTLCLCSILLYSWTEKTRKLLPRGGLLIIDLRAHLMLQTTNLHCRCDALNFPLCEFARWQKGCVTNSLPSWWSLDKNRLNNVDMSFCKQGCHRMENSARLLLCARAAHQQVLRGRMYQVISSAFSVEWQRREENWTVHGARGPLLSWGARLSLTETKTPGVTDMVLYCACSVHYWGEENRGSARHSNEGLKSKTCHLRSAGWRLQQAAVSSLFSPPLKSNHLLEVSKYVWNFPLKNNVWLLIDLRWFTAMIWCLQEAVLKSLFFLKSPN